MVSSSLYGDDADGYPSAIGNIRMCSPIIYIGIC